MVNYDFNNEKVSIIIRTLGNNKNNIERAIFSIYCSNYDEKEVVIVYQGDDIGFRDYYSYLSKIYDNFIEFKLVENIDTSSDQRAKNLNMGINEAKGRFLAILDDDDFVCEHHYCDLIKLIKDKKYIWGYSNCIINICDKGYVLKQDNGLIKNYNFEQLLSHNHIPIHSFIIDRFALFKNQDLINTDENYTRFEDYLIILKIASRYNPVINKSVGVYYNLDFKKNSIERTCVEYLRCKRLISEFKKQVKNVFTNFETRPIKSLPKIFGRIFVIALYFVPKYGKRIISKRKVEKFIKDVCDYFYKM